MPDRVNRSGILAGDELFGPEVMAEGLPSTCSGSELVDGSRVHCGFWMYNRSCGRISQKCSGGVYPRLELGVCLRQALS